MAARSLDGYRLRPLAEQDLEEIWLYSAGEWGPEQAEAYLEGLFAAFELLSAMPDIARERLEFVPPVRIHPSAQHLIIYQVTGNHLDVLRILGGQQNWRALLDIIDG
ncbi:type II toxin-antitoxin system RelE/ParE family toxin [Histidinibacterium aquaticum]|uniref:Toxin n=1 Tax=Histidinibacterium aquaticum TaxID=2613962 RepID=A0A5J5GB68_9RHOB|nr:type II toxin-antitoxin system RelE/ParE family toxin [Histidinibacterium aquaticum]KAA9005062.1 type II toxin-antitoxin system RelE/ParE family toxin [Histidinibacterium aquaticum]